MTTCDHTPLRSTIHHHHLLSISPAPTTTTILVVMMITGKEGGDNHTREKWSLCVHLHVKQDKGFSPSVFSTTLPLQLIHPQSSYEYYYFYYYCHLFLYPIHSKKDTKTPIRDYWHTDNQVVVVVVLVVVIGRSGFRHNY